MMSYMPPAVSDVVSITRFLLTLLCCLVSESVNSRVDAIYDMVLIIVFVVKEHLVGARAVQM